MEKAKQVVSNFVSGDGKHKTTVDEDVRPSVTDEHVLPHRHENVMTALDKEVHQEHHHTVVQPVKHSETLPEKHVHNTVPVEHKVIHHGDDQQLRSTLERDAAKYKSSSVTHDTTHSATAAPAVSGERIHHHVHEHVQPIVQKETVAPEVVHTTIPIHETHHAQAVHHGTSTLPVKTMEEWKKEGGVLGGRASHTLADTAGCPAPYNKELQTEQMGADRDVHSSVHGHKHHAPGATGATGASRAMEGGIASDRGMGSEGVGARSGTTGSQYSENLPSGTRHGIGHENMTSSTSRESDLSSHRPGKTSTSSDKHYGLGGGAAATTTGAGTATTPRTGTNQAETRERPYVDSLGVRSGSHTQSKRQGSLADKLNPFKDADGDGKKGIMD